MEIKDSNGIRISSFEGIPNFGKDYFSSLFRIPPSFPIAEILKVRLKEHCANIRHNRSKKIRYGITLPRFKTPHMHREYKIHHQNGSLWKKENKRSLEIELNRNNLKKDEGLKISEEWKPILHNLMNNNNDPNA
jgi:hypothetical protein